MHIPGKLATQKTRRRKTKQKHNTTYVGHRYAQTNTSVREHKSKIDIPEKLAIQGTQDVEKQNKNTTQYTLDTTMRKQTQTT